MRKELDRRVRNRANHRCEYCQMPQSAIDFTFPIDHIIAQQHGGRSVFSNLALASLRCNRHKGPNIQTPLYPFVLRPRMFVAALGREFS